MDAHLLTGQELDPGTELLQKPLLHLATQFLNNIPFDSIDMDYMNLHQSAHGDREYAYINSRLNVPAASVYGWWGDADVQEQIADWQHVAVAYNESFHIKIARFGDTMRDVAVTEGDKVAAQIKLGWTVDYYPTNELVAVVNGIAEDEIDAAYKDLEANYDLVEGDNDHEKSTFTTFATNSVNTWGSRSSWMTMATMPSPTTSKTWKA